MSTLVTIGDFARMTYLSIKSLRYYHEVGLLAPASVDPETGYRLYRPEQVPTAQVIRRLRDLDMPLGEVRAVLTAEDVAERNAIIAGHLRRMERQLEQTQAAVSSLRVLLEQTQAPIQVEFRATAAQQAIAVRAQVGMSELGDWWAAAFDELHATLTGTGARRIGPDGALYSSEFFAEERGETVAFVPVAGALPRSGRVEQLLLPATELAVTLHQGAFGELDKTYGALGTFVSERAIGVDGPIRENYLVTEADTPDESRHRIEVCWPVFRTTTSKEKS
ncbi:MAG TPA: MerR family transcriptional regulator [Pseudonocardiaceae bacterium]|nr:MerR family transcriptional regulator [Pseudonocardiaceae bacterium]